MAPASRLTFAVEMMKLFRGEQVLENLSVSLLFVSLDFDVASDTAKNWSGSDFNTRNDAPQPVLYDGFE